MHRPRSASCSSEPALCSLPCVEPTARPQGSGRLAILAIQNRQLCTHQIRAFLEDDSSSLAFWLRPTALMPHHLLRMLPTVSPCWSHPSPATAAAWWPGQSAQQPPGCHCKPLIMLVTLTEQRGLQLTAQQPHRVIVCEQEVLCLQPPGAGPDGMRSKALLGAYICLELGAECQGTSCGGRSGSAEGAAAHRLQDRARGPCTPLAGPTFPDASGKAPALLQTRQGAPTSTSSLDMSDEAHVVPTV